MSFYQNRAYHREHLMPEAPNFDNRVRVLQEAIVLPEQLERTPEETIAFGTNFYRLAQAIYDYGIESYFNLYHPRFELLHFRERKEAQEDKEWVMYGNAGVFTFDTVCDILGKDSEDVRRRLGKLKERVDKYKNLFVFDFKFFPQECVERAIRLMIEATPCAHEVRRNNLADESVITVIRQQFAVFALRYLVKPELHWNTIGRFFGTNRASIRQLYKSFFANYLRGDEYLLRQAKEFSGFLDKVNKGNVIRRQEKSETNKVNIARNKKPDLENIIYPFEDYSSLDNGGINI